MVSLNQTKLDEVVQSRLSRPLPEIFFCVCVCSVVVCFLVEACSLCFLASFCFVYVQVYELLAVSGRVIAQEPPPTAFEAEAGA